MIYLDDTDKKEIYVEAYKTIKDTYYNWGIDSNSAKEFTWYCSGVFDFVNMLCGKDEENGNNT